MNQELDHSYSCRRRERLLRKTLVWSCVALYTHSVTLLLTFAVAAATALPSDVASSRVKGFSCGRRRFDFRFVEKGGQGWDHALHTYAPQCTHEEQPCSPDQAGHASSYSGTRNHRFKGENRTHYWEKNRTHVAHLAHLLLKTPFWEYFRAKNVENN